MKIFTLYFLGKTYDKLRIFPTIFYESGPRCTCCW